MSLMYGEKMPSIFDGSENTIYGRGAQMSKEEESRLLHIVNDNPMKFETIIAKMTTSTTKLSMQINEIFHSMFSDYYGSDVRFAGNGMLSVSFVFKAIPVVEGDDKRAFLPIQESQKSANDTVNRIFSINAMNNSKHRTMTITDYGMEIMYDLMSPAQKKKVNPKNPQSFLNITGEVQESAGLYSTVNTVYCTMVGIDLYRVLDVVFGQKDKDGNRYVYKVNPMKPLNIVAPGMAPANQNWVIEIERMTLTALEKLGREIGAAPVPGSISVVTETISK